METPFSYQIRPVTGKDRQWIRELLNDRWGSSTIVTRGRVHDASDLPGFAAFHQDEPVGLLTFHQTDGSIELVSLDSLVKQIGIGRALLDALMSHARDIGCHRIWLITTNDNVKAMRFYQKCGFVFTAIYPNEIEKSRELKPEIPKIGKDGIPLRDEIEMEFQL